MASMARLMVRVQADTRGFISDMVKAQAAAQGFQASMLSMTRKVGVGMAATGAAAAAMFTGASIKAAMDFETAFTGVAKTVDGTSYDLDKLRGNIRGLAKEIPVSANELARIGQVAGQLGVRGTDNITGFIDTIARIGVSTDLTTEAAAISFARLAHVTGVNLGEAGATQSIEKMASAVVALGNTAAANEPEILEFASRIAASAHQVGFTQAEILALSATLPELGIRAERGATAIQRGVLLMSEAVVEGGDKLDKFAAISGMSSEAFAAAWKEDAFAAMETFLGGLNGMGEEAAIALDSVGLGGQRSVEVFMKLMGATDQLGKHLGSTNKEFNSAQALTIESNRAFSTFASTVQVLQNHFNDLMISAGDAINKGLKKAIVGLLQWWQDNGPKITAWYNNELKPVLEDWMFGMQRILTWTGKLFNFIISHKSAMISVLMAIALAVGLAFGGLPIIIGTIITLIPLLVSAWEDVANAIIGVGEAIVNAIVGSLDIALTKLSEWANQAIKLLNKVISGLNKIPGLNIGLIGEVDLGIDWRASWGRLSKPYRDKNPYDNNEFENQYAAFDDAQRGTPAGPGVDAEALEGWDELGDKVGGAAKEVEKFADTWEKLQDALQEEIDANISALDELGGYVVTALKRRYDEQMKLTEDYYENAMEANERYYDRLEESARTSTDRVIKSIEARRDAQLAALQAQLDAMDQQDVADEFQEIEDALKLAWDPRDKKKLLDDRKKLEDKVLRDQIKDQMDVIKDRAASEVEQAKEALEAKLKLYDREREAHKASLERQLATAKAIYEAATDAYALETEARKLLEANNMEEIIELIKTYVPEWETAGRSLGEQLVYGLRTEVEPVISQLLGKIAALKAAVGMASAPTPNAGTGNAAAIAAWNATGVKNKLQGQPDFALESIRNKIRDLGGTPAFKDGGRKSGDGWAYLHDGETIHNRLQEARHGEDIVVQVFIGDEQLDSRTVRVVKREIGAQLGQSSRYSGARQY